MSVQNPNSAAFAKVAQSIRSQPIVINVAPELVATSSALAVRLSEMRAAIAAPDAGIRNQAVQDGLEINSSGDESTDEPEGERRNSLVQMDRKGRVLDEAEGDSSGDESMNESGQHEPSSREPVEVPRRDSLVPMNKRNSVASSPLTTERRQEVARRENKSATSLPASVRDEPLVVGRSKQIVFDDKTMQAGFSGALVHLQVPDLARIAAEYVGPAPLEVAVAARPAVAAQRRVDWRDVLGGMCAVCGGAGYTGAMVTAGTFTALGCCPGAGLGATIGWSLFFSCTYCAGSTLYVACLCQK